MAGNLKTIVIGTSLSHVSDAVVRMGADVARASGAEVWLVHTYSPVALPPEMAAGDGVFLEQQTILRESLDEQARRTGLSGLPGFDARRLRLVLGSPPREILEIARQAKADLIVIGAAEGGAVHRILLGSTADEVIRKAPCPVLLVRSETGFPPSRVEIPVDLSPVSADALRQGLDLLAGLGMPPTDAEALFVLNPFEVAGSIQFTPEQIERMAGGELDRFLAANGPAPVRVRTRIATGQPWETIVGVLAERRADLAILGTHGRGGFERLMLGSVASEVVRHAACNLLVVPPSPQARLAELAKEREKVVA